MAILEGEYVPVAEAQEKHQEMLLAKENVVGVATGHKIKEERDTGEPSVVVFVSQKIDKALIRPDDLIPETVEKFKTDVIETGEIFAGNIGIEEKHEEEKEEVGVEVLHWRIRPAKGGFSVGHHKITAGTIATCVYDLTPFPSIPRKYYLLSNNHVLANSNDAKIGDPILQPGPYDGGKIPADIIARLSRFVPIKFMEPGYTPRNNN